MSPELPPTHPSENPPERPLTEAERLELRQECIDTQKLFRKLIEEKRERSEPRDQGRGR
jgi:hypothetical protein